MTRTYLDAAAVAALCAHAAPHGDHAYRAQCPVHNGDNPQSLHISQAQEKTLLHCFAHQCSVEAICAALGILPAQLFREGRASAVPPAPRRQAPPAPVLSTLGGEAPVLADDILLSLLLDSLSEDLSLLQVPEAQQTLRKALDTPLKKAMIERKLRAMGHYPPTVYAAVGYPGNGHADVLGGVPAVVTLSHVEETTLQWLWYPYLAQGTLAMLDGDPGIGKSMLTLGLASALSRGQALPDQQGHLAPSTLPPSSTVFLAREDSLSYTVKPRVRVLGGDQDRIHYLDGWYDAQGTEQAFTLDHFPVLVEAVDVYEPALVVIDPIQAYLGPRVDMHRANETRPLLSKLAALAEQTHCTILCVRHPAKASGTGGGKAMMRGLGSVDFIGAARTGLFVEENPLDHTQALMALTKSNIGPKARTQIFSRADGHFQWKGVTRMDAEILAGNGRGPDPRTFLQAFLWLEKRLEGGIPVPATDIIQQGIEELETSEKTLRRAKNALGVVVKQNSNSWDWRLPSLTIYSNNNTLPADPTDLTHLTDTTGPSDVDTGSAYQMPRMDHTVQKDQMDQMPQCFPARARKSTDRATESDTVSLLRESENNSANCQADSQVCPACGGRMQGEVSPPRCLGCGARAQILPPTP